MKLIPLQSSCLAGAGYDSQRHLLEIKFVNDGMYDYLDVPAGIGQGLFHAESHGAYFNEHIRDRYRFVVIRKPRK